MLVVFALNLVSLGIGNLTQRNRNQFNWDFTSDNNIKAPRFREACAPSSLIFSNQFIIDLKRLNALYEFMRSRNID
jgi:hypothetical protein